ncbi:hypothetical protein C6P40_003177 [Pichia californica]|uniref:Uncharacterized protein n=1 Tax=Pichia californica TaxID=460514 RepID=A0A9P6WGX1_9ASCO|nr:hypothetical protein C6P42_002896 [[Candida] californica]KAG0686916.1 hypothetical protein C6P40_003177 [[Candida] californica]
MVQINPEDPSKFQFRKLDDPNDSTLISIYKHAFRYASPDLFIWGPLAPAHDALFARSAMARIQLAAGILILAHSFRRFPSRIGKFRRRFTRLCTFACGISFSITAFREISYFYTPNENPLYVEIQLARELSLLDPENKGKINKGNYWFGPKNFMPMNNEQYWKMVYSMEVNGIMSEQYLESELLQKYKEIFNKNFGSESLIELKSDELTSRLHDIVKRDTHDIEFHHSLHNEDTTKLFPLFNDTQDVQSKKKTLIYWTRHNPFDALQLQEYKEYYSYMFPRLKPDDTNIHQKK